MRLSITLILLSFVSLVSAQSYNSSTKIDESERKRLENQFKALKTFYINDDGLVVYQKQSNDSDVVSNDEEYTTENNKGEDTIKPYVTDTSKDVIETAPVITRETAPVRNEYETSTVISTGSTISKKPVNPVFIKKEAAVSSPATDRREENVANEIVEDSSAKMASVEDSNQSSSVDKEETAENKSTKDKTSKKSVFDKRPSKYKTMEEAALAVEALIENLKKDQASSTSSGSMSSRLSKGAGSATLRKRPSSNGFGGSYNGVTSGNSYQQATITGNSGDTSSYGDEPTYYINGKQVDRSEINKLRKRNIVNREVRTRNTASGNPNGEVWYEVRGDDEL